MVRQRDLREARRVHPPGYADTPEATAEDGTKWNPQLHVQLHATVLGQLAKSDKVRKVFDLLCEHYGLHRHAAVHVLANVIQTAIKKAPEDTNPLADDWYLDLLKATLRTGSPLYEKYVRPHRDGTTPGHPRISD